MKFLTKSGLLTATRLTRAGLLGEATSALQQMLRGKGAGQAACAGQMNRTHEGIAETLRGVLGKAGLRGWAEARSGSPPAKGREAIVDPGRFLAGSFSNAAGSRPYKLYVPASYRGQAAPLIVMLHGCTQSPDDFAAGTRMNSVAEAHGCLVVYPAQIASANNAKCWNWFNSGDQRRDHGEPSLIAGITRQVAQEYGVDGRRVYIAGMSAGGAAAAIMGSAYPDLYAAIGVHSGLACGAASDLPSALAAMRHGGAGLARGPASEATRRVPAIVFHGTRDSTVHPSNADAVIAQLVSAIPLVVSEEADRVPDGHAYRRILHADAAGKAILEQWIVEGGGHAWSGGSKAGSYTDPLGPNASREMMRFFLEHDHPGSRSAP